MAYVSLFTYQIIETTLEARAPGLVSKYNAILNLVSGVSYNPQGFPTVVARLLDSMLPVYKTHKGAFSLLMADVTLCLKFAR